MHLGQGSGDVLDGELQLLQGLEQGFLAVSLNGLHSLNQGLRMRITLSVHYFPLKSKKEADPRGAHCWNTRGA